MVLMTIFRIIILLQLSNVGSYEDKGEGQVIVKRNSGGKSITLDGQQANGQLEIYVGRVLSDEGYRPKSSEISKISAVIKKVCKKQEYHW